MPSHSENPDARTKYSKLDSAMQSPHNRFVLGYFGSPSEARSMLQAQLPESFKQILFLERLVIENSHFVDEHMAEVESDLLFYIPRSDRDGENAYVYVLWEHQRRRDSLMALRMWIYVGRIYRLLANEGRLLPGVKLPYVYPIVLFQGNEGWKKGLSLEDLIDLDGIAPELHRWAPRFEIDLIRLDEDTPRIHPQDPVARLGLSLMQAVMFSKVGEWLEEHIGELNQIYGEHRDPVMLILSYALLSKAGLTKDQFLTIIQQKGSSKMKYESGSVAEQLVEEGKAEGKIEGKIEGKNENRREVALRLIKKGMTDADISEITDLAVNTVAELRQKHDH